MYIVLKKIIMMEKEREVSTMTWSSMIDFGGTRVTEEEATETLLKSVTGNEGYVSPLDNSDMFYGDKKWYMGLR